MVNIVQVNANHGCDLTDFHPLVDYVTKLQIYTKGEISEFSVSFSLQLMFVQTLSNLLVCLSDKTYKQASLM